MTRFQDRSKPVIFEIAQVRLVVENRSPEEPGVVSKVGVVVYAEEEVSFPRNFWAQC